MKPDTNDPTLWHAYITAAPNFAAAQDRMGEAVQAGVDFNALVALQA